MTWSNATSTRWPPTGAGHGLHLLPKLVRGRATSRSSWTPTPGGCWAGGPWRPCRVGPPQRRRVISSKPRSRSRTGASPPELTLSQVRLMPMTTPWRSLSSGCSRRSWPSRQGHDAPPNNSGSPPWNASTNHPLVQSRPRHPAGAAGESLLRPTNTPHRGRVLSNLSLRTHRGDLRASSGDPGVGNPGRGLPCDDDGGGNFVVPAALPRRAVEQRGEVE